MDKTEYVGRLAVFLADNGTTMAANELAQHLNRNNFKTEDGTAYKGGRGTYTLIRATYSYLTSHGQQDVANKVASSFTKPNGDYAYV